MPRNYYTEGEITFRTYAALNDPDDFGGKQSICALTGRPCSSVDMKIRNIAAMLDDKGVPRTTAASGLTGRTTGGDARGTNWDIVGPLTRLTREELPHCCRRQVAETETGAAEHLAAADPAGVREVGGVLPAELRENG